jgi:hypothetical protein
MSRRAVLRGAGMLGVAALVPGGALRPGRLFAVEVDPDGPSFLTPDELEALRALVDRFIPGPPEDPDPGALQAGCAEAIDALLAAFEFDPPRIYAGGPFSDRAGSPVNHFEQFVPLDDYEARAWRLRIHGSGGDPDLEFNGPVPGWQATYREGLAALDDESGGFFATMPGPTRDMVINSGNPAIDRLVDVAFPHTLEFMYGPPEYGGNAGLVGWEFTNWDGDVQPRGWTADEVENPDDPGLPELLNPASLPTGLTLDDLATLAALGTAETAHHLLAGDGMHLSGMRSRLAAVRAGGWRLDGASDAQVKAATDAVAAAIRANADRAVAAEAEGVDA